MRKTIIFLFLLLSISSIVSATELKQGQVWKYRTRPGEENSTITILRVENLNGLGKVVHVRVDNIQLMNPLRGKTVISIPHMPFKESAIKRSITKLAREVPTVPDYQADYEKWRKAYSAGQAKVFGKTVSATLDSLFNAKWQPKK